MQVIKKELATFTEISNTDKDSIRFDVGGESLGAYSASDLAGKSILLTFLPASIADAEILSAYDSIFDADDHAVISLTGDKEITKAYMMSSGIMSSLYESIVWEQLTGYESVSTISIFQKAKEEGIELLQITKDNLETELAKLNTDDVTKQAVRNAVDSGNMVTIPAEDVTIGEWSGTGYIIMGPSGAGSYMITGGLNGGEIPAELTIQVIVSAIAAVMGTATLVTTLTASIFATICPVATVVACAALILIATVWIVDMYCSYYDYIYSGDLDSYNDTSNMAMQLYMPGDMELAMSQFIFAHYAAPYLGKTKGESTGATDSKTRKYYRRSNIRN